MHDFSFEPVQMPPEVERLRQEVREFIAQEVAAGSFTPKRNSWSSFDPEFSRKCGERGFIGMTWPKKYGGHERTALERYVMTEEMLGGRRAGRRALGFRPAKRPPDPALWQRTRQATDPAQDHGGAVLLRHRNE